MNLSKIVQDSIERAVGSKNLYAVANNELGPYSVFTINRRTNAGRFLGGTHANAGYSSSPLPLWFFGRMTRTESGYDVNYIDGNFSTTVSLSDNQVQWGRNPFGSRSTPWLIGGYRAFKQASGRSTAVNLQFSGQMLNSLRYFTRTYAGGVSLSLTTSPDQQDKAAWTNRKRRWLDMGEGELDRFEDLLSNQILANF